MTRYPDAAAVLGAPPCRVPALCCHSSLTAVATACLSLDWGTMPLTGELASLDRQDATLNFYVGRRSPHGAPAMLSRRSFERALGACSQPDPARPRPTGNAAGTCSTNPLSARSARP